MSTCEYDRKKVLTAFLIKEKVTGDLGTIDVSTSEIQLIELVGEPCLVAVHPVLHKLSRAYVNDGELHIEKTGIKAVTWSEFQNYDLAWERSISQRSIDTFNKNFTNRDYPNHSVTIERVFYNNGMVLATHFSPDTI